MVSMDGRETAGDQYADRLIDLQTTWWKRVLPVQAPYRWNLRRLHLGRTIDVGCGLGRNLEHIGNGSVGIDHNPALVEAARRRGLLAYTPEEFKEKGIGERPFDSLLMAHVLEHLGEEEAHRL